jgi:hypothetical protein
MDIIDLFLAGFLWASDFLIGSDTFEPEHSSVPLVPGMRQRPRFRSGSGSINQKRPAPPPTRLHAGNHEAAPAFPKKSGRHPQPDGSQPENFRAGFRSCQRFFRPEPGWAKIFWPVPGQHKKNFPEAGHSRIHADSLLRMGQHVAPPPAVRPPTLDTHAPVMIVPGVILVQWSPEHHRISP